MAPSLTILRQYAVKQNPSSLPNSILFSHNKYNITIFDAFPKALFHFLILPRPVAPLTVFNLSNLNTLLTSAADKNHAKECLLRLKSSANHLCAEIEAEMTEKYGFKWPVWMGFHAVPSMEHVHLHVISSDLQASTLKHKKHYNSYHPKLGFFLHLDDVIEWFDATDDYWKSMIKLPKGQYEPLLKDDLQCWRCEEVQKNFPTLREHLKAHFDADCSKAAKKRERDQVRHQKRPRDDSSNGGTDEVGERDTKRINVED